ncbi:hypothetical protein [Paenibacillus mucilaginosus]|uniref:Uncharacterized protein n=1 Tax=Paenibacillus mucilaginosus (strain KNP414) TaxID=1036673 RepID=F8F7M8_PAEMK|nr:hypothetical protein [Paenibacillus mucilaginosus]AEI39513.1 hypothetical protein KNP414_00923 [Paenibacillus mucilaginosus KNP414]MCG7214666.1 hypothetical protein [Paenibacillus mucilaginosus]WDM28473.1 hypothetical protein KCX80_04305 [Paenibacillus mucilaginosus]
MTAGKIRGLLQVLLGFSALLLAANAASAGGRAKEAPGPVTITIQSSPESGLVTELVVRSPAVTRALSKAKKEPDSRSPLTDTYITWKDGGTSRRFAVDESGNWHEEAAGLRWELSGAELEAYIEAARAAHYGRLLPWEEAKKTVAMKSICTVTDLETGLSFKAQRRAGRSHADMQPVTKADTAIMKEIYGGSWSWHRRAVLVSREGGPAIAASMHGMPHGGDGIPGNGFSGHFCIHFLGSSTHGSKNVDPDHQWMVYKAAGRLDEALREASPYGVAQAFLVALNQQETGLLQRIFADPKHPQLLHFQAAMKEIQGIRAKEPKELPEPPGEDATTAEILLDTTVYREGHKPEHQVFHFRMKRGGKDAPWQIEDLSITASAPSM